MAPDHREAIGIAVWEFLWCIDRTTKEVDGVGLVHGGKDVTCKTIGDDLGLSERTVRRNLNQLEAAGYVTLQKGQRGYVISVPKSKKWTPRDRTEVASLGTSRPDTCGQSIPSRPDTSVTQTGHMCPVTNIMKLTVVDSTNQTVGSGKSVQPSERARNLQAEIIKMLGGTWGADRWAGVFLDTYLGATDWITDDMILDAVWKAKKQIGQRGWKYLVGNCKTSWGVIGNFIKDQKEKGAAEADNLSHQDRRARVPYVAPWKKEAVANGQ